ncbi:MAG: LacI family transcriptional regulator [Candidatus Competibacteraceae bacterium]|nr:LacI family transcriptional regulator [Candidatus Competibacteraceae bacterium]
MLEGILEAAKTTPGVSCELLHVDEAESIDSVVGRISSFDGTILIGTPRSHVVQALIVSDVAMVMANLHVTGIDVDCVVSDDFDGGRQLGRYLLNKGFRRIGWISLPDDYPGFGPSWGSRIAGLRSELAKDQILAKPSDIWLLDRPDVQSYREVCEKWIKTGDIPEVVVTPYCLIAFIFLRVASEAGLRCPSDFGIATFDRDTYADLWSFPLTLMETQPREIGRRSLGRLVARLRHPGEVNDGIWKVVVPVNLVEGGSLPERSRGD